MITVNFYTTLRLMLGIKEIQVDFAGESSILKLLNQVEGIIFQKTSKNLLWKLLDEQGNIKRGTIILIDGVNILDTDGLESVVKAGNTVALFPPGGGG